MYKTSAIIFLIDEQPLNLKSSIVTQKNSYEMPPRPGNITKRPHYVRNVSLDEVQIKFNIVKSRDYGCLYQLSVAVVTDDITTCSTISGSLPDKIT